MSEKKNKQDNAKKSPSRNKLIIILGCVIGIGVLTTVGIFLVPKLIHMMGKSESSEDEGEESEKPALGKLVAFVPLPELLVNLKMYQGKGTILKATFVLQVANEKDVPEINRFVPLITDQFQTFLREMTVIDMQGAAGIERIRQELLVRINQIVKPVKVIEVLVKDFLVQ
jgi:flagellar FliL protein